MTETPTLLQFVLMSMGSGFCLGCIAGYGWRMLVEKWERPPIDYEAYVRDLRRARSAHEGKT